MRRKWLIAVAAAVFALAVAGGAVFAAARRGDSGPAAAQADRRSEEQDKLLANVAAKLGLDVAKVKDAHQQAVRAVETEQRTRLLNDLVAKGRLTREQADALNSWLGSRPDSAGNLPGVPGLPGIPGAGPGMMPMPGGRPATGVPGIAARRPVPLRTTFSRMEVSRRASPSSSTDVPIGALTRTLSPRREPTFSITRGRSPVSEPSTERQIGW